MKQQQKMETTDHYFVREHPLCLLEQVPPQNTNILATIVGNPNTRYLMVFGLPTSNSTKYYMGISLYY